jgi:hypothetical protein
MASGSEGPATPPSPERASPSHTAAPWHPAAARRSAMTAAASPHKPASVSPSGCCAASPSASGGRSVAPHCLRYTAQNPGWPVFGKIQLRLLWRVWLSHLVLLLALLLVDEGL